MKSCRICSAALGPAVYQAAAPGISSVLALMDVETSVFVCPNCSHVQSPDLPSLRDYYDSEYKISLQSDDHDQLVSVGSGGPVYRTDLQADIAVRALDPQSGERLLDFGAAKARTLRGILARRPELDAYVFDVSSDYARFWGEFLPADHTATYSLPEAWAESFDLVTAFFVLEHIADPVAALKDLRRQSKPGGRIFVLVPNMADNPGDALAVDHLNHFTEASLRFALAMAGFAADHLDTTSFPGAFVCVAAATDAIETTPCSLGEAETVAKEAAMSWTNRREGLLASSRISVGRKAAIFGAGLYGAWILSVLRDSPDVALFLDSNLHVDGTQLHGRPILHPSALPTDVETVYVALNPVRARSIVQSITALSRTGLTLIYL